MIRRPQRSTESRSAAASDVYKRQVIGRPVATWISRAAADRQCRKKRCHPRVVDQCERDGSGARWTHSVSNPVTIAATASTATESAHALTASTASTTRNACSALTPDNPPGQAALSTNARSAITPATATSGTATSGTVGSRTGPTLVRIVGGTTPTGDRTERNGGAATTLVAPAMTFALTISPSRTRVLIIHTSTDNVGFRTGRREGGRVSRRRPTSACDRRP